MKSISKAQKRRKVITIVISLILVLTLVVTMMIGLVDGLDFNKKVIDFNGNSYEISQQITDDNSISVIKTSFPNTNKTSHGYKIYASADSSSAGMIFAEKSGKLYSAYIKRNS